MARRTVRYWQTMLSLVLVLGIGASATACKSNKSEEKVAQYGTYGANFAKKIASANHFRAPYSDGEKATAKLITAELEQLGYKPEIQTFADPQDSAKTSENIIVNLPGTGFHSDKEKTDPLAFMNIIPSAASAAKETEKSSETQGETATAAQMTAAGAAEQTIVPYFEQPGRHRIVFGAHYDTALSEAQKAENPQYDGINDNASGVGCLMTLAKQIKGKRFGYDVALVFFGARYADTRGATVYAASIEKSDIPTDSVYVADSLYAGDKVYSDAGWNSLLPGRKYLMRRKLYETTDIYLQSDVYTQTGVAVYTNQAGFMAEVPGFKDQKFLYREFTLKESDYTPFDRLGLPIVYFESNNYKAKTLDEIMESTSPAFADTKGKISGTKLDSLVYLEKQLPPKQLEQRINAVAFIFLGAIESGMPGMLPN